MISKLVLETSAIIAILTQEDESEALFEHITEATSIVCPASCVVEAVIVLTRRTNAGVTKASEDVLNLLDQMGVTIAALDANSMEHALDGYSKFGKGTGKTPATLNFGDCLAYGVAKSKGGKLIYTGNDFGVTDLA
jgi:ribonuclease VapC